MGPRGQRLARTSGRNDNCCWNCRRDNEGDGKWGGGLWLQFQTLTRILSYRNISTWAAICLRELSETQQSDINHSPMNTHTGFSLVGVKWSNHRYAFNFLDRNGAEE